MWGSEKARLVFSAVEFQHHHPGNSNWALKLSSEQKAWTDDYSLFELLLHYVHVTILILFLLSIDIFEQVGNLSFIPADRTMKIATAVNDFNFTDEDWLGHLFFIPGKKGVIYLLLMMMIWTNRDMCGAIASYEVLSSCIIVG